MYFKNMPTVNYNFNGTLHQMKDIGRRVIFEFPPINEIALVSYYIKEGETPDMVSYRLYNDPYYQWLIFFVNNITDVLKEWPMSQTKLYNFVEDKYGANNSTDIHHYYLTGTDPQIIVDYDELEFLNGNISFETNFAYEESINNAKRQIKVINSDYISYFVRQYKELIKS